METKKDGKKRATKRGAKKNAARETVSEKIAEKKRQVLKVLSVRMGIVSLACEKVGISRQTFYRWKHEDPEFAQAVEEVNERALDLVEGYMFKQIEAGDSRMIMFYLNNRGRRRGYGYKNESGGDKNGSITLRISQDEAEY